VLPAQPCTISIATSRILRAGPAANTRPAHHRVEQRQRERRARPFQHRTPMEMFACQIHISLITVLLSN